MIETLLYIKFRYPKFFFILQNIMLKQLKNKKHINH